MTDWARSTIAKTRMWTSAVKAAEQQGEANVGTHREPVQVRRTLSRLGSWYGMRGCRLLASRKIRWCGTSGYYQARPSHIAAGMPRESRGDHAYLKLHL